MKQSREATLPGHILLLVRITKVTWTDINPLNTRQNVQRSRFLPLPLVWVVSNIAHVDGQFSKCLLSCDAALQGSRSPVAARVGRNCPVGFHWAGYTNNFFCITRWRQDPVLVDSLCARAVATGASPWATPFENSGRRHGNCARFPLPQPASHTFFSSLPSASFSPTSS